MSWDGHLVVVGQSRTSGRAHARCTPVCQGPGPASTRMPRPAVKRMRRRRRTTGEGRPSWRGRRRHRRNPAKRVALAGGSACRAAAGLTHARAPPPLVLWDGSILPWPCPCLCLPARQSLADHNLVGLLQVQHPLHEWPNACYSTLSISNAVLPGIRADPSVACEPDSDTDCWSSPFHCSLGCCARCSSRPVCHTQPSMDHGDLVRGEGPGQTAIGNPPSKAEDS